MTPAGSSPPPSWNILGDLCYSCCFGKLDSSSPPDDSEPHHTVTFEADPVTKTIPIAGSEKDPHDGW